MRVRHVLWPLALVGLAGCFPRDARVRHDQDTDSAVVDSETGDSDTDADSDSDTDSDTDSDADTDADSDADTDTEVAIDSDLDGYPDDVDCNDADQNIHPGAPEVCDDVDQDCDDAPDDGLSTMMFYADVDEDGSGDPTVSVADCSLPSGYVATSTDCDDGDKNVNPGAIEVCNGVDDDCEGGIDEGLPTSTYYADGDGDGVGGTTTKAACAQPSGYVSAPGDCNDSNALVKPGTLETCDGTDNNCSGNEADASDLRTYFADTDGDTFGNAASSTKACAVPIGYAVISSDCDDTKPLVNPGGAETCNGIDDDCDAQVDEIGSADGTAIYMDADNDGHGAKTAVGVQACSLLPGYAVDNTDCLDTDTNTYPGQTAYFAFKRGDGKNYDFNCDSADEKESNVTYFCGSLSPCGGLKSTPGWSATPPACGVSANYDSGNACTGACSHAVASRTQGCR